MRSDTLKSMFDPYELLTIFYALQDYTEAYESKLAPNVLAKLPSEDELLAAVDEEIERSESDHNQRQESNCRRA